MQLFVDHHPAITAFVIFVVATIVYDLGMALIKRIGR